jgi:hypothetical protein
MPLVIPRKPIFMCTICGKVHSKAEEAVKCEAQGIYLSHCREGDIIDRNYDPKTKRDFLCAIVGRDDRYWINLRDKVVAVRLDLIGPGYPYGHRPGHDPLPMTLLCKNKEDYNTKHYTNITAGDGTHLKKVASWNEYFEEIRKQNPTIADCENFMKYGSEDYIVTLLYNVAKGISYRISSD